MMSDDDDDDKGKRVRCCGELVVRGGVEWIIYPFHSSLSFHDGGKNLLPPYKCYILDNTLWKTIWNIIDLVCI